MIFPLARFWRFAQHLRIPSKEAGSVALTPLGTQRYFIDEVARGLEDGIHFFIGLKGRQQGFSTISCALDLFWMLDHAAMQGQIVNDSDDNHVYFRDIIKEMLGTLPDEHRLPVVVDNDDVLRFGTRESDGFGGSRLMYQVAGLSKRKRARLGRGRGINYLHGDELGYWQEQQGIDALVSSLARDHPRRLYILGGTANGDDVFKELWDNAAHARTRRRIFIGWWRHEGHVIPQGTPLFDAYGRAEPSHDELGWMREIRNRYGFVITPEQLAWYRQILVEDFRGSEDMRAQEHPCLESEAFVSFGDKYIKSSTVRRLRAELAADPEPQGYGYEWATYFDKVRVVPREVHQASLVIWEQPQDGGVYMLGAKPADEDSDDGAISVYRMYPDLLRQVAEYVVKGETTYQFAWALVNLAGAYSPTFSSYVNIDGRGTGFAVQRELDLLRDQGWGLSPQLRNRQDIRDILSNFHEYLFRRPDSFGKLVTRQWKGTPEWRPMVLNGLRDCLERRVLQPRSPKLIEGLAAMRSGDQANADAKDDARVSAAALACRHYMDTALDEIGVLVAPSARRPGDPEHVGEYLVGDFIGRVVAGRG